MDGFLPFRPSVCRRCGCDSRPLESVIVGTTPNVKAVWLCPDCKRGNSQRGIAGLWFSIRNRFRRGGKSKPRASGP